MFIRILYRDADADRSSQRPAVWLFGVPLGLAFGVVLVLNLGFWSQHGPGTLVLRSHGGVSLKTRWGRVAFENVGGAVRIDENGAGLTVASAPGVPASVSDGGPVSLTAHSPLTFAVNTTSAGGLSAATTETAAETTAPLPPPDDDITVNTGVTVESTGGDVSFTSADSVVLQPGSVVRSDTGNVSLTAGSGDNDNDASASLTGTLQAPGGNVTISSPGDVCVGAIDAPNGTVTITSGGAITACPGTGGSISASSLQLSASTGIGGTGNPIRTQVGTLGAGTSTGGVFIANTGALNVAGTGVRDTGSSGDVQLTNAGSINIGSLDNTANGTIAGPGNVTVTANGAVADITTGGDNDGTTGNGAVNAGGTATVTAGRDIVAGSAAAGFGDIDGSSVVVNAGRDFTVQAGSFADAHGTGSVTATAGGNIAISSGRVSSQSGAISLTAGAGGTFTVAGGGNVTSAASGTGAPITISADTMAVSGPINAGSGGSSTVTLQAITASRSIDLGRGSAAGDLGLSDSALGQVTAAGGLIIGRTDSTGTIVVTGPVTAHSGFGTLSLVTGGAIADSNTTEPDVTAPNLTLTSALGSSLNTSDAGSLTVTDTSTSSHAWTAGAGQIVRDGTDTVTFSAPSVTLNGGGGADTFTVTPSGSTTFTINGGAPATSPGDTLLVRLAGVTTPALSDTSGSGSWTFGNRDAVEFTGIESAVGPTTTTVTSSANPSARGQPVTFTATVISQVAGYTPDGTGQFSVDGSNIGSPVALDSSGQAALTTSALGSGNHTIAFTYLGGTYYAGSNDSVSQTVNPATVTISTTPSASSVTLGTGKVTLQDSATLSGGYNPTGSITFYLFAPGVTPKADYSNATYSESIPVSNGNGTYTTVTGFTLPANQTVTGTYQWEAAYRSADNNNNSAADNGDPAEQVTVGKASPSATTMATPSQATVGNTLADSATLSGGYSPAGSITFTLKQGVTKADCSDGTSVYTTTVSVSSGNATYSTPANAYTTTSAGSYGWLVSYSGDGNNNGASSCEPVTVQYGVKLLYKAPRSAKVGSTVRIKLELTNAAGQNVSSANIGVQALCVVVKGTTDCSGTPPISYGPGSPFTFMAGLDTGGGYQFTVKTAGLAAGATYQLLFRAGGEPATVFHREAGATFTLTK